MSEKMDLSLLPSQAKFQIDKLKWAKRSRTVIAVVTGLWLFGLVSVVALNLLGKWQFDQADKKLTAATKDLAGMADGVVSSQRLKYNAKLVGSVLSSRFEYGKAFKTMATIFPEGITLDRFELQNQGTFIISGQADGENIDKVEAIVAQINQGNDERFSSMALNSLLVKNNIWSFGAEVKLK